MRAFLLMVFLLSAAAEARDVKLLVEEKDGEQRILVIHESGGYADPSRVLWDERVHGPMPSVQLGGMVASDVLGSRVLTLDASKLAASRQREADARSAANQREARARHLKSKHSDRTITLPELLELLEIDDALK